MKLAAFPSQAAFLPALAAAWLAAGGNAGEGLLMLPSRRAARAAAGAFLQANGGAPLLLPRIIAPGAIDEAGLALHGALTIPPAVPPMTRRAILAKLILAREGAQGAPRKLHTAWALAGDLAALLDEADLAAVDLRAALPGVVAAELASHWQVTLQFLEIVTHAWPQILAEMGMVNPAARQALLLDIQAQAWATAPPPGKIWLVTRDAPPALERLARVVAGLPQGAVILPGYDAGMSETAWDAVDDGHAQAGIARLLASLGARREEVECWPAPAAKVPAGRTILLSRALAPAAALQDWQAPGALDTTGLTRLAARDEQEDATAIAMIFRDALEVPGQSAALVTPDRSLARRVTAALRRFGIRADDSAGEALADSPPAILLRLLARAAATEFAPLPLLALLQHPLSAGGAPPSVFRANARRLEMGALRGPRPAPGFDGIKFRLDQTGLRAERDFLDRLEILLLPVTGLPMALNPGQALRQLIEAGEALAASADEPGAIRLWAGEAGSVLSDLMLEALEALADLPDIAAGDLADLLDALLEGGVVRKPRTRDGHPRIAIWGVREAALQTVDVAVLGGLVEGVWPAAAEPGPWLSRPMRKAAGLPAAEQSIGAAAADFFELGCRCPQLVLAAPTRRDRAPAVPARWITRLEALLSGAGATLPLHPAAAWARQLDRPASRATRGKPAPRPPAAARPTSLSISDIATLIADPYAIYARKILRIRKLDDIDEESDANLFGNIVHEGLAKFFAIGQDFESPAAAAALALALQTAMRGRRPRAALDHWWAARLERIAGWIVAAEQERRWGNRPVAMALELKAAMPIGATFKLTARADRIERREDGSVFIMDYKTGAPPKPKSVQDGTAPQLPLEAVMAEAGAFGPDFAGRVTELGFWKLSGRQTQGESKMLFSAKPAELRQIIDAAAANLLPLFEKFANPTTPYLATPHPARATYNDPYQGISRAGEWRGDEDGGAG